MPAVGQFSQTALAAAWLILLAAALVAPYAFGSASPGDDVTRGTVWVSLAFYFWAMWRLLPLTRWGRSVTPQTSSVRLCWTLAWIAYLVHVTAAFHFYHSWSHAAAVEHTRQSSGFGEGIYFSHLFTAVWTADVIYWWLAPQRYFGRPRYVVWCIHGYMLFIVLNATVVFGHGPVRWIGGLALACLLWRFLVHDRGVPPLGHPAGSLRGPLTAADLAPFDPAHSLHPFRAVAP